MKQLVKLMLRQGRDGYVYHLRWIDETGKDRYVTLGHCDTKKAEHQRREKEIWLKQGPQRQISIKLTELIKLYLDSNKRIESSTVVMSEMCWRFFVEVIGDIDVSDVEFREAEKFQKWCLGSDRSPATANAYVRTIRPIFRWAVKRRMISQDPFDGLRMVKVPKNKIRVFSSGEFAAILNAAQSPEWKTRILLAKTAGLRKGEILNLTLDDVDFERNVVYVQQKAETEHTWRWQVKDKDRRELPLLPEITQLLADIQLTLPEGQPYLLIAPERYQTIMSLKKQGKLNDKIRRSPDLNFTRAWNVILKRAGVKDADFHDLRRTCITEWLETDLRPHEAMRLAGHSDLNTTMTYYVGIRQSIIDRARQASKTNLASIDPCNFRANSVRAAKIGQEAK